MNTTPDSDGNSPLNTDDFNNAPNKNPENIERGTHSANSGATTGHSDTPKYGDFGHVAGQPTNQQSDRPAGTNPDGEAAPSTADPNQRGSVPQNLNPTEVRNVEDEEYRDQREGWAKDDPRYGGGTRNWATNEPANKSTGSEEETADSERRNPNDGSNDNPDEFSALRPDGGAGIPGK
jgi:hypothetical protein